MALYSLQPEHEAQIEGWKNRAIEKVLQTGRSIDEEKLEIKKQVKKLYEAANLTPPPDKRIVIVPSPMVLRVVGGIAAAVWNLRQNNESMPMDNGMQKHTDLDECFIEDSKNGTWGAIYHAAQAAIWEENKTVPNLLDKKYLKDGPYKTDENKYYSYYGRELIKGIVKSIFGEKHLDFAKKCIENIYNILQGGNMWYGSIAFIGFFRHIVKLNLDYSKYDCYEQLGEMSGYRLVHEKFCIVSEKPTTLKTYTNDNGVHVLHNEDGPALQWGDGFSVYSLNGIYVPRWLVETKPENISPEKAFLETNADVQREIIRKIGFDRLMASSKAKVIDKWTCFKTDLNYTLRTMQVRNISMKFMCFEHASMPGIFYTKPVPPEVENCIQGRGFQCGCIDRDDLINGTFSDEEILEALPSIVQ